MILILSLLIGLRLESNRKLILDFKKLPKRKSRFQGKNKL